MYWKNDKSETLNRFQSDQQNRIRFNVRVNEILLDFSFTWINAVALDEYGRWIICEYGWDYNNIIVLKFPIHKFTKFFFLLTRIN